MSAVLSPDGAYRYRLTRSIAGGLLGDDSDPAAMLFVMLNPSTADATADDPTIRRCMGFARREGCARLEVVNLFAWRATKPTELSKADDPVGPDNNHHVMAAAQQADLVVAAWGTLPPALTWRAKAVTDLLGWMVTAPAPLCLGRTSQGWPRHPLYVRSDAALQPWSMEPQAVNQ